MHDFEYDNPGSGADKSSISLTTIRDDCEGEGIREADVESMDILSIARRVSFHTRKTYGLRTTEEFFRIDDIVEICFFF